MSSYIQPKQEQQLAEAGMLDQAHVIDEAGIAMEEFSQPTPSHEIRIRSRLTSSYIVEMRSFLTSTKYILKIVQRDSNDVHILLLSTKMDFTHEDIELRNVA